LKVLQLLKFWGLVLVLVLISCSANKKSHTYSNYVKLIEPQEVRFLTSTVFLQDPQVYLVNDFVVFDKYMVLIDDKGDHLVKIFDLNNGQLMASFGERGQGPSEFISAWRIVKCEGEAQKFWVLDIATKNLKLFSINSVCSGIEKPERIVHLTEESGSSIQLEMLDKQNMIALGFYTDCRLVEFNDVGRQIGKIGSLPIKLKNDIAAMQHSHGFEGSFVLNRKLGEIFVATRLGTILEVYNIDKGLTKTLYGPEPFFPDYEVARYGENHIKTYSRKSRFGFIDITFLERTETIYVLYSGRFKHNDRQAFAGDVVYVLRSNGEILHKIKLDRNIYRLKISRDGTLLWGISAESEVLCFEISPSLHESI